MIPRQRIERAARIYSSTEDAALALGIAPGSFTRLCRIYQIETPKQRLKRKRQEEKVRRALKQLMVNHPVW